MSDRKIERRDTAEVVADDTERGTSSQSQILRADRPVDAVMGTGADLVIERDQLDIDRPGVPEVDILTDQPGLVDGLDPLGKMPSVMDDPFGLGAGKEGGSSNPIDEMASELMGQKPGLGTDDPLGGFGLGGLGGGASDTPPGVMGGGGSADPTLATDGGILSRFLDALDFGGAGKDKDKKDAGTSPDGGTPGGQLPEYTQEDWERHQAEREADKPTPQLKEFDEEAHKKKQEEQKKEDEERKKNSSMDSPTDDHAPDASTQAEKIVAELGSKVQPTRDGDDQGTPQVHGGMIDQDDVILRDPSQDPSPVLDQASVDAVLAEKVWGNVTPTNPNDDVEGGPLTPGAGPGGGLMASGLTESLTGSFGDTLAAPAPDAPLDGDSGPELDGDPMLEG